MDYKLPLSPPKRILDRLTPIKTCPKRERTNNNSKKPRLMTASQVMERNERWKLRQKELQRIKRENRDRRMNNAHQKRNLLIEARRQRARRFSETKEVWDKYKIKVHLPTTWDSGIRGDNTNSSLNILADVIKGIVFKRRVYGTLLMKEINDLKSTKLIIIKSFVRSKDTLSLLEYIMRYFKVPSPNCSLTRERFFLTSLLIIADSSTDPDEQVYDTRLGEDSKHQLSGYNFPGFLEMHYHDDKFYKWLYTNLLVKSQRLFLSFKMMIFHAKGLYSSEHLRFLNSWRDYLSIFLVVHHFHLVRSYMLLLQVLDILESAMAIELHQGVEDGSLKAESEKFQADKRVLETQISQSEKRLQKENDWFMYGMSYEEWVKMLFGNSQQQNLSTRSLVIPPGFTVLEWRRFRLERVSEELHDVNFKTRRKPSHFHYDLEHTMRAIGMKSFKEMIEPVLSIGPEVVQLTLMLFDCIGVILSKEQRDLVNDYKQDDYLFLVQNLFCDFCGAKTDIQRDLGAYLSKWRRLMIQSTSKFIEDSMMVSYNEFEKKMFTYCLAKEHLSIRDFIDELRMTVSCTQRALPQRTIMMEHIMDCMNGQKRLPLSFEVIETEICHLYDIMIEDIDLVVLFLLGSSALCADEVLRSLSDWVPERHRSRCSRWKTLFDIHFLVYHDIYEQL
jgi:hypothetical protein